MKIALDKKEAREIIKKYLESMFPSTKVLDNTAEYGDFEFEVVKKDENVK